MPNCDHCDETFDKEKKYLKHLKKNHYDELGRIEKQKVDDLEPETSIDFTLYAGIGIIILVILSIFAFFLLGGGGDGVAEPGPTGTDHGHGTIVLTINNESINFESDEYLLQDDKFHFENPGGSDVLQNEDAYIWHTHATGVTLEYALDTLGIDVAPDGEWITVNGQTYNNSNPGTMVNISVDGESVNPRDHVLQGVGATGEQSSLGDNVRIHVRTREG